MHDHVVVVIGAGGMGEAIARAQGVGRRLLVADFNDTAAADVTARLAADVARIVCHRHRSARRRGSDSRICGRLMSIAAAQIIRP
jgi:3-hydroxyacyl-CoA dehydrogenase